MFAAPRTVLPLLEMFAPAFTRPSFGRFVLLLVGSIVTFGRRTVSRILWTLGPAAGSAHPSSFHRFFSHARWSLWPLAKVLSAMVLELLPSDQAVRLAIDDTVFQHRGKKVYGKGCHRDAVRSAGGPQAMVKKWGHKWVVLAVLTPLPFTRRLWALPVLCALYRVPKISKEQGKRHKTPCDLAQGLVACLLHWFPTRRFILLGDGGYASHDLACFCRRHRERLTLVARGRGDMNLHALLRPDQIKPPCRQTLWRRKKGLFRPRCRKGRKLPCPADTVNAARLGRGLAPGGGLLPETMVQWYGQSKRKLELLSGCGAWYRGKGNGTAALVPLRWVYTSDPQTGKQEYFFVTDPDWQPQTVVEEFAGRWSIEVTFEEGRAHLGWETTRQYCANSVLRCAPCLLGLFSLVSLLFARQWRQNRSSAGKVHQTPCYAKSELTFADALYWARRTLWDGCLLKHVLGPRRVTTLPHRLKRTLITYLAEAG